MPARARLRHWRPYASVRRNNLALNFTGTFFTIQRRPRLLIPKGGSIIVTTSFLNTVGLPGLSILAATKAATRSLVRTLGAELAPRGIRVNAVSPGTISTPFYGKLGLSDSSFPKRLRIFRRKCR